MEKNQLLVLTDLLEENHGEVKVLSLLYDKTSVDLLVAGWNPLF